MSVSADDDAGEAEFDHVIGTAAPSGDGDAELDDIIASVSFMDGSAASFAFAQQPEEHELRSCVYAEFALSEDTVDVVFTQCCHVLEPLAFVDPDEPVCAVKRSVDAGGDCRTGSALPCELTPCCQRHREFRLSQRECKLNSRR